MIIVEYISIHIGAMICLTRQTNIPSTLPELIISDKTLSGCPELSIAIVRPFPEVSTDKINRSLQWKHKNHSRYIAAQLDRNTRFSPLLSQNDPKNFLYGSLNTPTLSGNNSIILIVERFKLTRIPVNYRYYS